VSALGSFRRYCTDEEGYVNSILAPIEPKPLSEGPILKLPGELLPNIANYFDDVARNMDLNNLALTYRRTHNIAREVLMRTAVVTLSGTRSYIRALLQRPEYVVKSGKLVLRAGDLYSWLEVQHRLDDAEFFDPCIDVTRKNGYDSSEFSGWLTDLKGGGEPSTSACLAVPFLLVPDLKDITLSTRYLLNSELLFACLIRPHWIAPRSISAGVVSHTTDLPG
jgi:hypothetical protein